MTLSRIPKRTIFSAAVLALLLLAQAAGLLAPLDRYLADRRYQFGERAASDSVVFVAIDKESLDTVGVWPWPRTVHAKLTDRLRELGAHQIVFDIDFSTPSAPEADKAFAEAIERAQGSVTLPVFLQYGDADRPDAAPVVTEPIEDLARNAWLATVNVAPDKDGVFRVFPTGEQVGDTFIDSVPATIAGIPGNPNGSIGVEFGIDPRTVPVLSAADVLSGRLDRSQVENRTAVIGAYATELNDFFSVPRFGYVPGAMLQILAAETAMAKRSLHMVDGMALAIPVFLLLLAAVFALGRQTSPLSLAAFAAIPFLAEPAAIALYVQKGLIVPTAYVHLSALATIIIRSLSTTELFRTLLNEATAEARNMRQVLEHVVRENFDAIVIADENGRVLQASEAVTRIFDVVEVPQAGTPVETFLPPAVSRAISDAIERSRAGKTWTPATEVVTYKDWEGETHAFEYTVGISELNGRHADGWFRRRKVTKRFVASVTARDVSERISYEAKLQRLSDYDELTGVFWRHSFVTFIRKTISERASAEGYAIVALNLHRFKTVNIALGRDIGNALLLGVASRLREADPRILGQARLGGDSFAVLIGGVSDEADALKLAEKIASKIAAPFAIERRRAQVGVQAGLTMCCDKGDERIDAETMLERAEMALDEARATSGSRIVFFDETLALHRTRARIIERDLWQALERGELHLHYQLQVGLMDNAPTGAEALLRWSHPELGDVSPQEFIPIAEANGFVVQLGRWSLRTACREAATWPKHLSVAVNLAPKHFASDSVLTDVKSALRDSGLAPERLTVEVVESELLDMSDLLERRIKALKALGVKLALDDFGTGYSAIGYLPKLRFDEIKVDKRFIEDLTINPQTQGIVRSVAMLAEAFEMSIVCEGVETLTQAAFLRLIGCNKGQGYLYSKPVDAAAFRALIEDEPDAKARA